MRIHHATSVILTYFSPVSHCGTGLKWVNGIAEKTHEYYEAIVAVAASKFHYCEDFFIANEFKNTL